ncbi:UDP-glycosyltransferase UGT5-like [Eupeodes corollae]|uniref:UDP-glycosyltransferase UGT5-like n=1 Tax=Eupeodes corollae TaxID=290404 RepID=UPI002491CAD6|nr:UDP-glycosyltransferase UGT5-like [Eupeodes corollae]
MSPSSLQFPGNFFLFILTTFFVVGDSARILGLFSTFSKSHLFIHCAVADALAERGHDVTVVTTLPLIKKKHRFRHIHLDIPGDLANFLSVEINYTPPWYRRFTRFAGFVTDYAEKSLNHPKMRKLMAEESFDLMLHGYFLNELLFGVAGHFKCPLVVILTVQSTSITNFLVGNPQEISYVPSLLSGAKQPLDFVGRVKNFFFVSVVEQLMLRKLFQWYQVGTYGSNFPPDKYPSFDEVKKNVSLILTNHHFSQTPIRPNVPAMVEIGGIQIKEKPDPLPEDIKSILDNSIKHGVVYFSLGTNVQGSFLDQSKVKVMFEVLSKLQQTVLWKWSDSDPVPGKSPNIIYKSWLPQDDILAHENVKLFVTHGGQGSVVESQYHGVPMVGIPLFGEQSSNMENVVKEGFGLSVDYLTITEKNFNSAVQEVLSNKKYTENVQRFAKLYKDRPMTAKETAVFWVEYVLRHHGAPHMQSPAVHLNIFQLLSLDVIGFLLAVLYISWRVIKTIVLLIFYVFRKSKSKVD